MAQKSRSGNPGEHDRHEPSADQALEQSRIDESRMLIEAILAASAMSEREAGSGLGNGTLLPSVSTQNPTSVEGDPDSVSSEIY